MPSRPRRRRRRSRQQGERPSSLRVLDRQSGETLGSFGGNGRYAGQLHWVNAIATDSMGNIYTGEVEQGKRIQKFAPVMGGTR